MQVYFPFITGEIARNYPLGKIEEQTILLNITDTESLVSIPQEFLDTGLEMALLFLASDTTFFEVFVIQKNYNLPDRLQTIENQLTLLQNQLNLELPVIQSKLDLILTLVNLPPVPLPIPPTQQQFFFLN